MKFVYEFRGIESLKYIQSFSLRQLKTSKHPQAWLWNRWLLILDGSQSQTLAMWKIVQPSLFHISLIFNQLIRVQIYQPIDVMLIKISLDIKKTQTSLSQSTSTCTAHSSIMFTCLFDCHSWVLMLIIIVVCYWLKWVWKCWFKQ